MSVPVKKVEIEVDPNSNLQPFFTLDSPTLGILDDPTGQSILGGLSFTDVTEYVVTISTNRGKANELERYDAGVASVTFDNTQRIFDPLGTSPYSEQLLPRRGIRVYSGGTPVFVGIVEDWDLNYNPNGDNTSIAKAADKFTLLAQQSFDAYTNTSQLSGARLNTILNKAEVDWTDARNIAIGETILQADVVDQDTNVLDYINLVVESEQGNAFIAKDGTFTFYDNLTGLSSSNLLLFTDDGTGVPFTDLQVVYGGEFIYNRVVFTRLNGTAQIAEDLTSQAFYGITTYTADGLLMNSDTDALNKAQALLAGYANPRYRFDSLTLEMADLSPAQQSLILSKEVNDVAEIKFTPNNIGSPIDRFAQIIGIKHDINNFSHKVTFKFRTLEFAPFVLDDPIFGILSGTIGTTSYNDSTLTYDNSLAYNGNTTTTTGYSLG